MKPVTLDLVYEKLLDHDKQFELVYEKLLEHDKQFELVYEKLLDHDRRFDLVDKRLSDHDNQLKALHERLSDVENLIKVRFDTVYKRFDMVARRLQAIEIETELVHGKVIHLSRDQREHGEMLSGLVEGSLTREEFHTLIKQNSLKFEMS